jgi:hypothetical protein
MLSMARFVFLLLAYLELILRLPSAATADQVQHAEFTSSLARPQAPVKTSQQVKVKAADMPVVSIPIQCSDACEELPLSAGGQLVSECMICLNSNEAINRYTINGLFCDGGNPAEYKWSCMRELVQGPSQAATTSPSPAVSWLSSSGFQIPFEKPPRIQRLPLYELGYTSIPAIPVLYPSRFAADTAMLYSETR